MFSAIALASVEKIVIFSNRLFFHSIGLQAVAPYERKSIDKLGVPITAHH